jgi:hypothetical protein
VGDGGGTFAALTLVALVLAALGDAEAALLIGSRCESRGVHRSPGSENVNGNPFGTAPYLELRSGQTAAVLDGFANGRTPLSTDEILQLADGRMERDGPPG